jgi:hypothetical protein
MCNNLVTCEAGRLELPWFIAQRINLTECSNRGGNAKPATVLVKNGHYGVQLSS